MTPRRIQRKRTAGWRMPKGAIYVGRPSRWGNPFVLGRYGSLHRWAGWVVCEVGNDDHQWGKYPTKPEAVARAVELFELHAGPMGNHELDVDEVRTALGGRDLACWCPIGEPCHGDWLLHLANPDLPALSTKDAS